jgi:ATP-dependent helicase Lhr and Lhr-like helicase
VSINVKIQTKESSTEELSRILTPVVKKWFHGKFKDFAPPQKFAIMDIHSRINTLVSAPTGSGKTLTAFLSVLNELVDSAEKGILEDRIYCVYISPLKALNNDVEKNLLEPLAELNEIAGRNLGIRVAVRTGDTTQYQKSKMLKNPPHILITTPESLAIVLSSIKFRNHFKNVEWCIIDEIHSLAEGKRGVHLSLSMERLQHIAPGMSRIGLSATVAPIEEVGKFLVGDGRDVTIVNVQFLKKYDLEVATPVKNLIDTPHFVMQNELYRELHSLIQAHKTTLIFTNTRAGTERMVDTLQERYPKDYVGNIGAHHGSMGKSIRQGIENRLKKGELKVCVSSTSLELGIDIGYIDLVLCLGSPKSVARFLQRCGRAGHQLHETVKGKLLVLDRDDLVECSILLKNATEHKIDRIHIPTRCLDVLAQHVAGMALDQKWTEREAFALIKRSYCYIDLKWQDFDQVLSYLAGTYVDLQERKVFAKIWRENGMFGKRGRMSRVIYMTNIGTIPSQSSILVKIGEAVIGKLDEGFLENMKPGDVFVLGGKTYMFRFSRGMVAQVRASPARPPTVPSWFSERLPLSFDLGVEISLFRRLIGERLALGKPKKEILLFIKKHCYVSDRTAEALYRYFNEQYRYCKYVPSDKLMLIEEIHDEETMFVFHTLFGRRVNDCLSRAIAYIISKRSKRDVEMGITDNGFYLKGTNKVRIKEALKLLRKDKLHLLMTACIEHAEVYKRRFRQCAERSLMILRNYKGRTKSVGRQQVSSQILMSALKRISNDFFLLKEAKREVLEDLMDIENSSKVVEWIENGRLRVEYTTSTLPSPFAFNIALQGKTDVLKIEDKHDFLRRMHSYVLAKISKQAGINITEELDIPFDYDDLWQEEAKRKEELKAEHQALLMLDAEQLTRSQELPVDYYEGLCMIIHGEVSGYRRKFLEWFETLNLDELPVGMSGRLARFLRKYRNRPKKKFVGT